MMTWGNFSNLAEAKQVYETIPDLEILRRMLFPAIAKMAKDDRMKRAEALLKRARKSYRALADPSQNPGNLIELRTSINRLLETFPKKDVDQVSVLLSLKKSLRYLNPEASRN